MLNNIIGFSVRNKLIIALFVCSLIGWGTYEVTKLPIDALPDITDNQVQVITVSPSLGAPDIERLITFPIEQSCSSISGLKQIRSFSRFGLSLVTIVFNEETDVYWARQQIAERLQQVQQEIPQGIGTPQMAPVSTGLGEIYQYVVRPKKGYEGKYDAQALRTIQDWIVRRQLLGTPGVAEVSSFGGRLKQYEVAVKQDQLKAFGLTIADVFDALEKNNGNTGGAYIEKGPTVLYIRSEGLTTSLADIEKIVVKTLPNGMPVLMGQIAKVQFGSAIRYGAMTYNAQGEVAGAVVMMLKGENSSVVVKRVKDKVVEIQKMLPEGVVVEPFLDRTKMVDNAISTVETNLLEGALIVIFVLVFFLGNLRAGLIVSSVIPLSMLFAIILMNTFGVGGNLMSLGAIDFGLIVDGSVIVVEAILHRFSHSKHFRAIGTINQNQMDAEVEKSTGSMIKSAVFSQIIILIVYLPILSLEGIEGKMFKPMAWTIAFAILGAFILSVTYVPMMSALCLNKTISHKKNLTDKLMIWIERRYQPALSRILGYPKMILMVTVSLFVIAVFTMGTLGGEFIPQLEEGDFAVETRLLTGSNLQTTIETTQQAAKILLEKFPEVEKIVTKIGSAEVPTDPMPFEAGDMMVILKPKKQWTSASSFPELSAKMTKAVEVIPGITVGFQFPVQMRFNELMTGARQDIVCKIFGEDLDSLAMYSKRLGSIIGNVKGAINIYEEQVTGMPQVVIKYNRDGMAQYGINVEDVNRVVNTAFAGQVAGQVYEGEKRFDMVVRLDESARKNIKDVENLMILAKSGNQIPLSLVASVVEEEGINQIQRENTRRRIIVGFNVKDRDVQSIVEELQLKADKELKLAKGYTITYGGSFENMTAAKSRLAIVVPIALLLIFLLLYFAFNSVKQGLLIYTAIPLSAIGGIFALWIRDLPFSISAGVGFIALFGVAVLNGILLVTEFNRLKKEGWTDVKRIVIHATKSKLRAVLMTALVPSLGFIPMAISTGAGGAVQKPLATVVIGGLLVSTLLTLFVLPMLYILFEKGFGYFNKTRKSAALIAILILISFSVNAQQPISLKAALDTAVEKNLSLQILRTEKQYYQQLTKNSFDVPKASVSFDYGKFNSLANDNKFSISQGLDFPTVYTNQRKVNQGNLYVSEQRTNLRQIDLQTEVKISYYQLLLLREKKNLLVWADSIYSAFLKKSTQRFKSGDVDALELRTAENQKQQITNQLELLKSDYKQEVNQFNFLLNSKKMEPMADSSIYQLKSNLLSPTPRNPMQKLAEAEVNLAKQQRLLEKSKLLPSLLFGYNNSSIVGWQSNSIGTEQYFDSSKRFSSINVGLGIPIFSGAYKSKIKASGIEVHRKEQELDLISKTIVLNLENAQMRYLELSRLIASYQKVSLSNSADIVKTASEKLYAGEIAYLDWVILINQSIQLRSEYYEKVQQLNQVAFEIERITATEK
ncbi:cobalt-zinc-cadmium resistance protein CzcA [Pedobacter psychrotolerans]|uniref:Acriflavine resistance protein B n=1 Tax=Pedobacter psychrotolerans TaxID=1843235 RepID=A0A4R2HLS1_9SPHI|nr:CusA/CzcA family heavy metal efflux RND transporter [Pedobacter psychrotolerans]TCO31137.1 cobalt-zinc-cadmium resistance protein CzcA [Pedobacter psychrotolerans]GGE41964.1 acriflavine resistance protein B [Pedobacter psychrotolerans]